MEATGGIGASIERVEDARHLFGEGEFVADVRLPGTRDVAFVRSPLAHARVRGVTKPGGREADVFAAADLEGVAPIHAPSALPGFKRSRQPVFAADRVRHVGEILAACVAEDRAAAEDLAEAVGLDLEELPAVHDSRQARDPAAPLLHDEWGDNVFLESVTGADLGPLRDEAAVSVTRTFRTARQCMSPLEGRAVLAWRDRRQDLLVVWTAGQMPHIVRNGLAECLGIPQGRIRVVAPDVGGGFGYKGILLAEEVFLGWLAMRCRHPVRWIEDRREQLTGNANCREHHYVITGHAAADGRLLGIECEAHVDTGAYSALSVLGRARARPGGEHPPRALRLRGIPLPHLGDGDQQAGHPALPGGGADRGVLRPRGAARRDRPRASHGPGRVPAPEPRAPGADAVRQHHRQALRQRGLPRVPAPGRGALERGPAAGDGGRLRERPAGGAGHPPGGAPRGAGAVEGTDGGHGTVPEGAPRYVGRGFAVFCEQAAHGTSVYAAWGVPMVPGHEQATARLTPDGGLELRVGVHSTARASRRPSPRSRTRSSASTTGR